MYSFEQLFLDDDDDDDVDCRPLVFVLALLPIELPHPVLDECASPDGCCVHLTGRTRGGVA